MRVFIGAVALLTLCGLAAAQDKKDDKKDQLDIKKLLGKWEVLDAPKGGSLVLEFADKGKLALSVEIAGKTEKIDGTYKLDGNKLEMVLSFMGKDKKEQFTVTKLTDDELVAKDPADKEEKFKRKK